MSRGEGRSGGFFGDLKDSIVGGAGARERGCARWGGGSYGFSLLLFRICWGLGRG